MNSSRDNSDNKSNQFLDDTPYIPSISFDEPSISFNEIDERLLPDLEAIDIDINFNQPPVAETEATKRKFDGDENQPRKRQRTDDGQQFSSFSSAAMFAEPSAPSYQLLQQTIVTLTETNKNQQNQLQVLALENASQRETITYLQERLCQQDMLLNERNHLLQTADKDRKTIHSFLIDIQFHVDKLVRNIGDATPTPRQAHLAPPFQLPQGLPNHMLLFPDPRAGANAQHPEIQPLPVNLTKLSF